MTQFPGTMPPMSPVLSPAAPPWMFGGSQVVPPELLAGLQQRQGPQLPDAVFEAAKEALAKQAAEEEQRRRAAELMQQILTPQQQAAAPGFQGAVPATAAGPVWQGDLPSFTQAAMAAQAQVMAGQPPTYPGTYMPPGPPMGSPESYAAMQQPGGGPVGRPTEGRFSTLAFDPQNRSTENRQALAAAMGRLKERRGAPVPEAKRRELVTAHRRGQTPSGYRADIGQPSPVDIAMLAGPQAAQMHEGVLGPMLEAERMKVQAEQEGHRLATLGSTLAAMMTANPNITPQQIAATREVMGMPSVPGTIPGGGPEDGNAVATFQAAAAAAGKTEEADKLLAEQDVAGIENLGKRIGLDNKVISQVIAEFERRPGGLLKAAEGLGKTIADIPLLKQGMTSTIDTLGPYLGIPSPRTPQPMAAEWIPAEPLEKVRRTALGTDEEAARARRWLIEHGYNTAVDFALP